MSGSLDTAGTLIGKKKDRNAKSIGETKTWLISHGIVFKDGDYYIGCRDEARYNAYLRQTCFGRLSLTDRDASLVVSPHSARKLNSTINLNSDTLQPQTITDKGTGCSTPTKYQIVPAFTLQWPNISSPAHLGLKSLGPSPYHPRHKGGPVALSPETREKAAEVPAMPTNTKTYKVRIALNDIIEAKERRRTTSGKVLGGLSAQQMATYEGCVLANLRYERLHMQANSLGGPFSPENIFIASQCANTQMIAFDKAAQLLLEQGHCQYIDITITCTLEEKADGSGFTHQAKDIQVKYETDVGLTFGASIEANRNTRPTVNEQALIITTIINYHKLLETPSEQLFDNSEEQDNKENNSPQTSKEPPLKRQKLDNTSLTPPPSYTFWNSPPTPPRVRKTPISRNLLSELSGPLPFRP